MVVLARAVDGVSVLVASGPGAGHGRGGPRVRSAVLEENVPDPGGNEEGGAGNDGVRVCGTVAQAVNEEFGEPAGREFYSQRGELVTDP